MTSSVSPWTWVEPFAGAAACALRLVGGRDLLPPVAWMGGKRRYARAILDAMGVPSGPPSRVLLADAGPWGWVWPLLLEPGAAARVAGVLRSWSGEHPRDLWQRLAAQPPAEDLHERAAQWLWLQARSASGVPIWWDGWRLEGGNGKTPTDRGGKSEGRTSVQAPWQKGLGGRWEKGTPGERQPQDATNGQRGQWRQDDHATGRTMAAGQSGRGWRFDARPGDVAPDRRAGPSGQTQGRTGGMVNPCTIATRVEALAQAFGGRWMASDGRGDPRPAGMKPDQRGDGVRRTNGIMDPVSWSVLHGDARDIEIESTRSPAKFDDLWIYLDPPYVGATGYGWDMPRPELLQLARRWHDAGAVVAVSEAEPIDIPGWHPIELTHPGGKPEWLTLSRPPAVRPMRQGEMFEEVA